MRDKSERVALGRKVVPISFGEQIITSLLFNHDANPVHHKPDHAVQWVMGMLATNALSGVESHLANAGPEERTYSLGYLMLQKPNVVVMPGIILAAISYECFIRPEERVVSLTNTFTYPLLVPTKGSVDVEICAYAMPGPDASDPDLAGARKVFIEAYGPSITGGNIQLLKLEASVYPERVSPDALYEKVVSKEFETLLRRAPEKEGQPELRHPAAISEENRRQYAQIVGHDRPLTPGTWQAKITRALTEITDRARAHKGYRAEVKAYYENRPEETERRRGIERYVQKEVKYRFITEEEVEARIEELAGKTQNLYARQYTVFDPRMFQENSPAVTPSTPFSLDLRLYELRLRRGIHRFFTQAVVDDQPVFMGDAMVGSQPLISLGLLNFLYEINHSFERLELFEYQPRQDKEDLKTESAP